FKGAWEVTRALLRLSGFCMPAALVFFVASAVALAWQLLWIKQWTDANSVDNDDNSHDPSWVWGLTGLCLGDVVFRCIGGALLAASVRQLSRSLHHDMLSHVLFSPVSYFDSTPRGRILNRFAIDLEQIDSRFYLMVKVCIQNVLMAVSRFAVVATQSPVVLGIGGIGAVILRLVVRASNEVRFVEGAYTSRLLQHVTEAVDSLSSIRSYGMVERFCSHFCRLVDANMVPYNAYVGCYRISRALVSAVGFVIVFATLIFTVVTATSGASSVGLALSSSLLITMASFERALEYTELAQEPELLSVLPVDQKWPTEGRLEFKDYATSYRPGILSDVLKGVTFVVQPQEKVGVVGRTGAGKSSLVLALLRILKSSRGSIRIDGVDIKAVPLRRLRNAVTVIPQVRRQVCCMSKGSTTC
ncbi:unnamed protein product, partial [Ixodes pacificus]